MADIFTKAKRSQLMSAIRSKGNASTEAKLAAAFRAHKISGWRRHLKLPGRPDFYFKELRLAIFVDGCFWHGCKRCRRIPKSRRTFWQSKIMQNVARDRRTKTVLKKVGIQVLRIWEHQLKSREGTFAVITDVQNRLARPAEPLQKTE